MDPNKWDTIVWYRVTRNPQEFHGLTGCQWDSRIWGVTERERERREKKKASFSGDFMRFCLSKLGGPRVQAALCDESYAWVPKL